ncbi:MAG: OmpH family outer membrane protein [Nitrospira sp.]|jgi:outer membrane protein|nr:OmpH family outer membrane protein [Nitrospira sp. BO4]
MMGAARAIVIGIVLSLVQWVGPLFANDTLRVGVMDQQMVMERSKAGKLALEDVKGYSMTRQKIINSDEQELKDLEQSLQDPNAKLTDTARQEKEEQLRGKVEAYQRRLQEFNREVQLKQREMVAEYSRKIAVAAQAVAQKEGYTAILDKGSDALLRVVLYHQPALDVTELIIKEFDRQNP